MMREHDDVKMSKRPSPEIEAGRPAFLLVARQAGER
jgi:hypothetical protein